LMSLRHASYVSYRNVYMLTPLSACLSDRGSGVAGAVSKLENWEPGPLPSHRDPPPKFYGTGPARLA